MNGVLHWRISAQRADPIITRALHPVIAAAAVLMVVNAVARTIATPGEIVSPMLTAASLFLVVVAAISITVTTDPARSPAGFGGFAIALGAVLLADIASAAASWATSNEIWSNWGPLAVGSTLILFSCFRPARDLAAATVVSVLVVGVVAALEAPFMPVLVSPLTSVVISTTPVLLLGIGASVFSYRLSIELARVYEGRMRGRSGLSRRVRIRLQQTLRQTGRDALAVELVPYLQGVLERGEVTDADVQEARRVSAVLRSVLITDLGLPWL